MENARACIACAKTISIDHRYCMYCGQKQPQMENSFQFKRSFYIIDFGSISEYAPNDPFDSLQAAMVYAEQEVQRTLLPPYPNDILIREENGKVVAKLPWIGPEEIDPDEWLNYITANKHSPPSYGEWIRLMEDGDLSGDLELGANCIYTPRGRFGSTVRYIHKSRVVIESKYSDGESVCKTIVIPAYVRTKADLASYLNDNEPSVASHILMCSLGDSEFRQLLEKTKYKL